MNNRSQHSSEFTLPPGRTVESLMEAPVPSDPVEPIAASVHLSRPGPAVGCGAGVFQPATSGEYSCNSINGPSVPVVSHSRSSSRPNSTTTKARNDDVLIYYQNAGGMNCDVDKFLLATSDDCYDVIVLTETWLDSRTFSSQVFGTEYEVFRCDRGPRNSRKLTGGGVLVAVKKKLKSKAIYNIAWESVEQVWVCIEFSHRRLFLCGVYVPPDRTRDDDLIDTHAQSLMSVIDMTAATDVIIVFGDFNLPGISWHPSSNGFLYPDPDRSTLHSGASRILDCYSSATLRQINYITNENNRTLDLCFVSAQDVAPLISSAPSPLVKLVNHHPPLVLTLRDCQSYETRTSIPFFYDFRNADHRSIVEYFAAVDWLDVLDNGDVNVAAQTLSNIIGHVIDRHVPKKTLASNSKPWQTRELRTLKTAKRAALRAYSRNRTFSLREHYRRLNIAYKTASRDSFRRYQLNIQRNLKSRPKSFWRYVNEQRKESGLPSTMIFNGEVATEPLNVCQLFADKFAGTFCDEIISDDQVSRAARNVPTITGDTLGTLNVDEAMIIRAALQLKSSSNPGPDGIPSVFIKKHLDNLLTPIRHVFDLSLTSGVFPSVWKCALMYPVHKKGNRRDVNNYRGISTLCAISKLFELVVMEPLLSHCKQHLSNDQHGFISGRSTTTNLLCLTSHVSDSLAERTQTDVIYTDLSAAFDKINHAIAIAKLEKFGVSGSLLCWFNSYLVGRKLTVSIEGSQSSEFQASSGIPQGSHLGPIIFLLYFNDVNHVLKGPRLSFADDLKLFLRIRSMSDAIQLQEELNTFMAWCALNCMIVNPDKCTVISFARIRNPVIYNYKLHGTDVQRVDHVKDLGVILDSQLTFKRHVSYVVDKASRTLGFIFRIAKDFTDVHCLRSLYCSLVRSTLEYCSAVWHPYYQNGMERIESVQRRFLRYALRRLPWRDPFRLPSYNNRCQLIDLETLQVRRNIARAMFVADVLQGRVDCPAILGLINLNARPRILRNNSMLRLPFRRTNYAQNSAIIGVQRVFNRVASVFDFNLSRQTIRRNFSVFFSAVTNE